MAASINVPNEGASAIVMEPADQNPSAVRNIRRTLTIREMMKYDVSNVVRDTALARSCSVCPDFSSWRTLCIKDSTGTVPSIAMTAISNTINGSAKENSVFCANIAFSISLLPIKVSKSPKMEPYMAANTNIVAAQMMIEERRVRPDRA